ncbi:hypothetical protein NKG05_12955 [Oerskovia sp. M15]
MPGLITIAALVAIAFVPGGKQKLPRDGAEMAPRRSPLVRSARTGPLAPEVLPGRCASI